MDNRLHIRVDIDYKLNSEPLHLLKEQAEKAIEYLFGNGMFTGASSAEIIRWQCYVSPPRDKHVAVFPTNPLEEDSKVVGVFDGHKQARAACPEAQIVKLRPITDEMRALIAKAGQAQS